jgi:hypothetical protein
MKIGAFRKKSKRFPQKALIATNKCRMKNGVFRKDYNEFKKFICNVDIRFTICSNLWFNEIIGAMEMAHFESLGRWNHGM